MVADMSYATISNVITSWDALRRIPDYRKVAGVKLFRIFFELEPSAAVVFDFDKNEVHDEAFYNNPRLMRHAQMYISMLDRAIDMLGPDIDMLTDILVDMGVKHARFGVKPSMYPPMGVALLQTFQIMLGDKFTSEMKASWVEVYQGLSCDMMRAGRKA